MYDKIVVDGLCAQVKHLEKLLSKMLGRVEALEAQVSHLTLLQEDLSSYDHSKD
jgi:hypothetical protein